MGGLKLRADEVPIWCNYEAPVSSASINIHRLAMLDAHMALFESYISISQPLVLYPV